MNRTIPPHLFYGAIAIFVLAMWYAVSVSFWGLTRDQSRATWAEIRYIDLLQDYRAKLLTVRLNECQDRWATMSKFTAAVTQVGSIPYANPGANCYDHAKLLTARLAADGIQSSIMVNQDRSHAWVAVWVDANTGTFVPTTNDYGPVLELRDSELKVICD